MFHEKGATGYEWMITTLRFDFHAVPKRDVVFDALGQHSGSRIIPGGVVIARPIDLDMIVAGEPLPKTERVGTRRLQVLTAHRVGGKVVVSLNYMIVIAFSQDHAVPTRSCHCTGSFPWRFQTSSPRVSGTRTRRDPLVVALAPSYSSVDPFSGQFCSPGYRVGSREVK